MIVNFHTIASNWEQIQKGNNGKNHKAAWIKYLVQQKVKWKIEKLIMLSACPQKYPEERWKSYVLYWYS